jgi:hypothetical protein
MMQAYHYDWSKGDKRRKAHLRDYRRGEASQVIVTHTQVFEGRLILWLKTYGMDSWALEMPHKPIPPRPRPHPKP